MALAFFLPSFSFSCPLPISIRTLTQNVCTSIAEVEIATFAGELPYDNAEEDERTIVVIAYTNNNDTSFREKLGLRNHTKAPKLELATPPFPTLIEERHTLSKKGLAALQKQGWQIFADVIGYRGKENQTGPSTLCLLALSKKKQPGIAVATCSLHFSESTGNFDAILDEISKQATKIQNQLTEMQNLK